MGWASISSIKDPACRLAIQTFSDKLDQDKAQTWEGLTLTNLTASQLIQTDSSKALASVADLTAFIFGTANQISVTDNVGSVTLAITDPFDIPGKLTAGTFASPIDVTATREYGFEIHYSGNNYNATGIRSRASAVTTDTSAQFQGGLFQAANNDNINVGVLNGLVAEAIGKATTNAATISTMRGALIGAEWSAKDTVTDLRTLHVRTHTRDNATEGYFSNSGYGIYVENEAVGGNGQALTAGIYFKGTNLSAGNKAFDYGIDFSGGTYGTAEIRFSNGETIDNLTDGQLDITGDLVVSATLTAEQLTSTDDITMQGHLLTLGDGIADDVVIDFKASTYDGKITFEGDVARFTFGIGNVTLSAGGQFIGSDVVLTGHVAMRSTTSGYDLLIKPTPSGAGGGDRTLSIAVGNSNRTLTISGNPTIADWFDQSVKSGTSPTFDGTNFTGIPSAGVTNNVSATANLTDHAIVRGHGGAKVVQTSSILIDDSDNVSGIGTLGAGAITGTSLTDGTATITGGLGTFGGITIFNPLPILVFKDSTSAGGVSRGYIEWRDLNNTRLGYFGDSSEGNDYLLWKNESSGGHIQIQTTGAGEFQVFANTVLNGTLGAGAITGTSVDITDETTGYQIDGSMILTNQGTNCLSLGVGAGANNTGASCLFIGEDAGGDATTGTRNLCIGYQAGYDLTSGYDNVLIGSGAGKEILDSRRNFALGTDALHELKGGTAHDNVAIGTNALYRAVAGRNVAIGYNALYGSIGEGQGNQGSNIGIGYFTLYNARSAIRNIGIGVQALYETTTGDCTTAIGYRALYSVATGSSNVAIGYEAGYFETGSNKLFIDNIRRDDEADGRIKALVYGVFAAAVANQSFRINGEILGSYGAKIGDGGTTNYAQFAADGELALAGTARVEKEIIVGAASWHRPTSGAPDEAIVGLGQALLFDAGSDQHVHYQTIIPEDFAAGTEITVQVDWSFDTEEADHYVVWELNYLVVANGEDPAAAGALTYQQSAITTADGDVSEDKVIHTTFGTNITGAVVDDILIMKFNRDANGTNAADTLTQDARLHTVHLHYVSDKLGQAT